jgi:hypothetical protein
MLAQLSFSDQSQPVFPVLSSPGCVAGLSLHAVRLNAARQPSFSDPARLEPFRGTASMMRRRRFAQINDASDGRVAQDIQRCDLRVYWV